MPRKALLAVCAVAGLIAAPVAAAEPYTHTPQPVATGKGGAAATVDSVATSAATRVLRSGGNAVDAAVTAAAVLGVTEPYSCGIGGGGFMVIRTPRGEVTTIDSREKAPAAMRPDSFFENGAPLPFADARWSGLSAGVPGTPRAWSDALRNYGTYSLRRALAPAIDVALRGFTVDQTFFNQTDAARTYFDDIPSTAAIYLDPDGTPRDVGSTIHNPDLARTYARIGRKGVRGFYRGPIARAMVDAVQNPPHTATAEHVWRPGLMTRRDLRAYETVERPPTHVDYRGYDVYSMGPPSSGGSTVGEALNILEARPEYQAASDVDKLHLFLEASRYAFADRNAFLADPAFYPVPLAGLLADDYGAQRASLITNTDPGVAVPPGTPAGAPGVAAGAAFSRTQSTTHLTVVDRKGMVVTYTFTIESTGGNGIVVPGWGFLLNNELTDFNYDNPQHPNAPDGGKRPRSSISPTYVEQDGKPFLALGSPGGATIITTVLQILTERIDWGRSLPDAIADPRASNRNPPSNKSDAEQAFVERYGDALRTQHGHDFNAPAEIGAATGIEFLPGGRLLAAAEPVRRGGGSAQVVRP